MEEYSCPVENVHGVMTPLGMLKRPDEPKNYTLLDPTNGPMQHVLPEFKKCTHFVKATRVERTLMYERHSLEFADKHRSHDSKCHPRTTWTKGHDSALTTGYIDHLEQGKVMMNFFIDVINGQYVCFYDGFARYTDWNCIEDWLVTYAGAPKDRREMLVDCFSYGFARMFNLGPE